MVLWKGSHGTHWLIFEKNDPVSVVNITSRWFYNFSRRFLSGVELAGLFLIHEQDGVVSKESWLIKGTFPKTYQPRKLNMFYVVWYALSMAIRG